MKLLGLDKHDWWNDLGRGPKHGTLFWFRVVTGDNETQIAPTTVKAVPSEGLP